MEKAEDKFNYSSELTEPHIKKISIAIQKILDDDNYMAYVQTFLRQHNYQEIIPGIKDELIQAFAIAFEEVTSKPENGGLEYNDQLQTEIWLNILFGIRNFQPRAESGDRRNYYVNDFIDRQKLNAMARRMKKQKEPKKIRLAQDHKLFVPQSFDSLRSKYFTTLDAVIDNYCQKFVIDKKNKEALAYFINRYFIFIFINTLIQSKLVFEFKSRRGNKFFKEVCEETVQYLKEKIHETIDVDMRMFQHKFFYNQKNDLHGPVELSYQNAELDDIQAREDYLATHYFGTEDETAKSVRRKVMVEYGEGLNKIDKTFEMWNPGYYKYQDQVNGARNFIAKLEPGEKQEALVFIPAIFKDIDNYRQEQKKYETRIEREREPSQKDPSPTITEIQQQHLRYHKVPFQFRPLFSIIIHRYNHYYNLKSNILKKRDGYHELIKNIASDPNISEEGIIHCVNEFVTNTEAKELLTKKWDKKQEEKRQEIVTKVKKEFEPYIKKMIRKDEIKNKKGDHAQESLDFQY